MSLLQGRILPFSAIPQTIVSSCSRGFHPRQSLAIAPRHPVRWRIFHFRRVSLQFGRVVERVHAIEFAGVNQTHEQIAHHGSVRRLVEEGVLAIQNSFLQSTFAKVVIEWRPLFSEEQREWLPVVQQIGIALPSPEFGSVLASASCSSSQSCN